MTEADDKKAQLYVTEKEKAAALLVLAKMRASDRKRFWKAGLRAFGWWLGLVYLVAAFVFVPLVGVASIAVVVLACLWRIAWEQVGPQ